MDTATASPDLRYPIGRFDFDAAVPGAQRAELIEQIARLPQDLRATISGLTDAQLDTRYRPGGWTIRQVVHHVPESHMNSYIRFKLALTEDTPTIKPYDEAAVANLPDAKGPIEPSLDLLAALHSRWVLMLRAISDDEWQRTFRHPDRTALIRLDTNLALYAWHGRHHLAQISGLKERMGW
jgi:DinB superfamily